MLYSTTLLIMVLLIALFFYYVTYYGFVNCVDPFLPKANQRYNGMLPRVSKHTLYGSQGGLNVSPSDLLTNVIVCGLLLT